MTSIFIDLLAMIESISVRAAIPPHLSGTPKEKVSEEILLIEIENGLSETIGIPLRIKHNHNFQ